jgi:ElaB/YqjD/DUF883 family membrane-anchored ribosome-binding protein
MDSKLDITKVINDAIASVITEGAEELKEKAGEVGKKAAAAAAEVKEEVKEKAGEVGKKVGEVASEAKEKAVSVGKKAVDAAKEHPGVAAAIAAALAAGVGGLALRKRLKGASKK